MYQILMLMIGIMLIIMIIRTSKYYSMGNVYKKNINDFKISDNEERKINNYYELLSDNQFATAYNQIGSKVLSAKLGTKNTELLKHAEIVRVEKKLREQQKNINYNSYFNNQLSYEDNKKQLYYLLNQNKSAEIFTKIILCFINNYYDKNGNVEKICIEIMDVYIKFDKYVSDILKYNIKKEQYIEAYAKDKYITGETTGLGFGIVTSNIINMAIYSALDNYEKKKQLEKQIYNASSVVDTAYKYDNNIISYKVREAYDQYKNDIRKIIEIL